MRAKPGSGLERSRHDALTETAPTKRRPRTQAWPLDETIRMVNVGLRRPRGEGLRPDISARAAGLAITAMDAFILAEDSLAKVPILIDQPFAQCALPHERAHEHTH